jgi:hypothetical protein
VINSLRSANVTFPAPRPNPPGRTPPNKYLALWIALPIMAAFLICGAIGAALDKDDQDDAEPQPVATVATTTAATTEPTPTSTPSSTAPAAPTASATSAPPTPTRTTTTTKKPPAGGGATTTPPTSVYYKNCTEVKAAGAAPLYSYEPGYRPALDSDKDGVACES